MVLLLFLSLFIASLLYIVSKIGHTHTLSTISLYMLKQLSITIILFNAFNISFSTGIHFKYSHQFNT